MADSPGKRGKIRRMQNQSCQTVLEKIFDKQVRHFDGQAGVFFRGLQRGEEFHWHDCTVFRAASLIKIPLFLAAAEMTEQQDWNMPVSINDRNRVGGTGILAGMNHDIRLTWRELMTLSAAWSDNTAANQILDCIGGFPAVQDWLRRNRMEHTQMNRKMMDRQAAAEGKENWTCASDVGEMLSRAVTGTQDCGCPYISGTRLLGALQKQHYRNKLPALIPAEPPEFCGGRPSGGHVLVQNKTGDWGLIQHDAGIFTLPSGGQYILSVCTEHSYDGNEGCRWIAELSRDVWTVLSMEHP